jgi:hypothetical protein
MKYKSDAEVWVSHNGELFEAIPLYQRMKVETGIGYKIDFMVEPERPLAYAVYHPENSDNYIFINAEILLDLNQAWKLSDL